MNKTTPTRTHVVVLKQMLNLIPRGMINRHALATGVEAEAHTFSVVNHLSAMLFAQLYLYRRRWDIEVFFKQVKQSFKLGSFLGHRANAVRWQVYTALLVYVLLRFMAHLSGWGHSFTRLFAVTLSALWVRINLLLY